MAPKETKKDRERRLKREEQLRGAGAVGTDAATDAPTDGPTGDNEQEEPLLYDAEGGLMRPGTSAAPPNNAVAKMGASPTFFTSHRRRGPLGRVPRFFFFFFFFFFSHKCLG
jgi:hypothetical protein